VVGAHELRNRFGWYLERAAAGEEIRVTRRGRPSVRLIGEAPVVLSPQMAGSVAPPLASTVRSTARTLPCPSSRRRPLRRTENQRLGTGRPLCARAADVCACRPWHPYSSGFTCCTGRKPPRRVGAAISPS
jgi:prevent-host-death family protein